MRKAINPMSLTKKLSIQLASRLAVFGFFWGQSYSEKHFKVTYSDPVPSTGNRSVLSAEKLDKATA